MSVPSSNETLNDTALLLGLASLYGLPLEAISLSQLSSGQERRRLAIQLTCIVWIELSVAAIVTGHSNITEIRDHFQALWNGNQSALAATLGYNLNSRVVELATREINVSLTTLRLEVVSCPAGFWGADGRCIPCAPGSFGNGSTISACTPCP